MKIYNRIGYAREGIVPPEILPEESFPDTLTGLYQITGSFQNHSGCQAPGEVSQTPAKFMYFYPANLVFPMFTGWFGKECSERSGCDMPDGLSFLNIPKWSAGFTIEPDKRWSGATYQAHERDQMCDVVMYKTSIDREDASNFKAVLQVFKAKVPIDTTLPESEQCSSRLESAREAVALAPCSAQTTVLMKRNE